MGCSDVTPDALAAEQARIAAEKAGDRHTRTHAQKQKEYQRRKEWKRKAAAERCRALSNRLAVERIESDNERSRLKANAAREAAAEAQAMRDFPQDYIYAEAAKIRKGWGPREWARQEFRQPWAAPLLKTAEMRP